jgi:hypothetical protein
MPQAPTHRDLDRFKQLALELAEANHFVRIGAVKLGPALNDRKRGLDWFVQRMKVIVDKKLIPILDAWKKADAAHLIECIVQARGNRGKVRHAGTLAAATAHELAHRLGAWHRQQFEWLVEIPTHEWPRPTTAHRKRLAKNFVEAVRHPAWTEDELKAQIEIEHAAAVAALERIAKDGIERPPPPRLTASATPTPHAVLDGKMIPLKTREQVSVIVALATARGGWVNTRMIPETDRPTRPGRTIEKLPAELRKCIESSGTNAGWRLILS